VLGAVLLIPQPFQRFCFAARGNRFQGLTSIFYDVTQRSARKASLHPRLYAVASFAGWLSGSNKIRRESTAKGSWTEKFFETSD
jgi:hypothetical protein